MTLPTPDPDSLDHSRILIHSIRQQIRHAGGVISFADYMKQVLYSPGLGYYSAGAHKLGREGDFVTAPEISPLFARSIANQFEPILAELGSGDILELGAGSGVFAKDLLIALEKRGSLPQHYFILEVSGDLAARQQQLLQKTCPHLFSRMIWLDTLPIDMNGIIVANEVLDAMPVNCFQIENTLIKERGVSWENNAFVWHLKEPMTPGLQDHASLLQQTFDLPTGYVSEINLALPGFMRSLAACLKQGVILLIDYGYERREYYRPDRVTGTLMCFYQHHRHDDPFIYPGLQDITAHVDFTAVAETATDAGLSLAGYTTQAGFLLACGMLQLASSEILSPAEQYVQSQAIKTLTLPSQMGELIKAIGFVKNYSKPLLGFELQDRRRDL